MQRVFSDQELVRRGKLRDLQEKGQDPFAHTRVDRTHDSAQFRAAFDAKDREDLEKDASPCTLAGRVVAQRQMFAVIQDQFGRTQLFFPKAALPAALLGQWKALDIGDIVAPTGTPMKTNTGELTLKVASFTLVAKSLRVLPEKYHGLVDEEERARRRYVDLIVSEESRRRFLLRSLMVQKIREYMAKLGYIEVETPILQDVLGGAAAKPFVTHHNALDRDYYLRIATELHLKRCIVGGMDRVFELGRVFRNEGMDATHNPEFTTLEAYASYQDISDMMRLVEDMLRFLVTDLGITDVKAGDQAIDLQGAFKRIHMVDLVKQESGVDFWKVKSLAEAEALAKTHSLVLHKHQHSFGHILNLFFEHFGEKACVQPTFVYGYPVEISPLAKLNADDPRFTERFELFIAGKEYANAFSELNDPVDQYERFEKQLHLKDLGDEEANEMDLDFVEALEYGMPPTGGIGIGIDRVAMLLTGATTIRDVLLFPHMRKRQAAD